MEKNEKTVLRRDFLKGAAAGVAGLAAFGLVGCSNDGGSSSEDTVAAADEPSWDREVDVVIVGSGGAGLSAAIEASAAGANTLVLEKNAIIGGTTGISSGITQAAGTEYQKEFTDYQDDTPEKHFLFMTELGEGWTNDELVKDIAYGAPEIIRWYVEDLGVPITAFNSQDNVPWVDESLFASRIHRPEGQGGALINAESAMAESNGAVIETDSEVTKLITDTEGAVLGVQVKSKGGESTVKANKGVILASGNIDWNMDMARELCPQQVWALECETCFCCPTNTGDGIRMGMEIGAAVTNFGGTVDAVYKIDKTSGIPIWGHIYVNKAGQRYVSEDAHYAYKSRMNFIMEKSMGHPSYVVFAESNMDNNMSWDRETIKDAIADGLVISAPTLAELCAATGVFQAGLENTLTNWNEIVVPAGVDEAYGRKSGFERIEGNTYYAVQVKPDNMGSCGGLKIDIDTRVLRPNGEPIPGLFAAGMVSGGWIGPYYQGSGTAMAAIHHFGRKAGKYVATQ